MFKRNESDERDVSTMIQRHTDGDGGIRES